MRLKVGIWMAVAAAVFILPIIVVQAQGEGEGEQPAGDVAEQQTEATTTAEEITDIDAQVEGQEELAAAGEPENTATPAGEEEGSVLGAEAVAGDEEETVGAIEGASEETAVTDATSSEAASEQATEEVPVTETAATTTSQGDTVVAETAATSTPPVDEPKPVDEPYVLQPAVKLHVNGSLISADITLDNLTCKRCGKVLPAMWVKAYYTAWYPNDGPEYKEPGTHLGEQEVNVSDVALWSSRAMSWSANDIASGRYYFVVVVDPENANGAYRMHRTEFTI